MAQSLEQLDANVGHTFLLPVKKINDGQDVTAFLTSEAYRDITLFLVQLNRSMFPRPAPPQNEDDIIAPSKTNEYPSSLSGAGMQLSLLLKALEEMVDEVPLDPAPRRFGNAAFKKWCQLLEERSNELLSRYLPESIVSFPRTSEADATTELRAYLLGAFGSSQRLDYGTGHELSFLAFLACVWKLGGFPFESNFLELRGIVVCVIWPYLNLVRKLILKYSLEPAGSHGVWGLDDHSFLPYIFGSAQYGPTITESDPTPTEGSSPNAPDPGIVTKVDLVEKERSKNLYFSAIGFIYDVKKGPFWEHSPTLYDISGVRAGWAKINKGMLKMYNAEVLSKFPVVQHFPFGSLFSWERDPNAKMPVATTHTMSHPTKPSTSTTSPDPSLPESMQAPWASARSNAQQMQAPTRPPWATTHPAPTGGLVAPGQTPGVGLPDTMTSHTKHNVGKERPEESAANMPALTRAPWAK